MTKHLRQFFTKKMLLMLALGFSSGLPFTLIGQALQGWFTAEGASIVTIASLGLLSQPYSAKFIWAPLLDKFQLPWLTKRRGWIIALQLILAFCFFLMSFFAPSTMMKVLLIIAFLAAFLSASQDIVVDAYRTENLSVSERGVGVAMYIGGYRIAMMVSGGISLMLAQEYGFEFTYRIMAMIMLFCIPAACFAHEPPNTAAEPTPKQTKPSITNNFLVAPFKELFSRRSWLLVTLFLILYKLDSQLVINLLMPYLSRELHYDLATIGFATQVLGLFATMAGIFIGGSLMSRYPLTNMLILFGIMQALSTLLYATLDWMQGSHFWLYSIVSLENFSAGMATAASIAYIMSLCDKRYTATQFALLSAFANLGRVLVAPLVGYWVEIIGWSNFYMLAAFSAIPALLLLIYKQGHLLKPALKQSY